MPGTEYVIKYIDDISEATQGAKRLESINKDMAQTISGQFTQATRVIGTSLSKVSETPIKLKGGEEAIKTVSNLGTVIQTSNGRFKEFTKTQTFINGQLQKTSGSLKDVTGQFGKTAVETAKASKNTLTMGENMGRLAKRALLTIPVWLALRGAIMGTFKVIRDGFKTIEDQDRAFQKAKRTLQGSTNDIARNFKRLREEVTKLSLETGESVEKITNAFYKFSTVGFDFETSMKGAEYAVKSAIVQFGDAEDVANAFARAMRVLVDRSKDAKPAGEQIAEAMALTTELWKSNAFELNEFTQSLEKFAGTARATNFTTQQTIALLASLSTAGLRGGRAGRLLRTSVVKLLTNLDKLSSTLGVKVNPQLDSTFDVLMRVLDAVQGLDKGSQVAEQTANAIGKIFGGVRGMEAILGLKVLRKEMLKNIETVGGIDKLNEAFEDVSNTISRQITKFHNLNKLTGMAFVSGLVGGEDFLDTMKEVNKFMTVAQKNAKGLGEAFIDLATAGVTTIIGLGYLKLKTKQRELHNFRAKINEEIVRGLRGKLSDIELKNLIVTLTKLDPKKMKIDDRVFDGLSKQLSKQLKSASEKSPVEVEVSGKLTKLSIEQQQDIAKLILDVELDRLKTLGATNSQLLKAEDLYSRQLNIEEDSLDKLKRKLEYEKSINEERRLQNKLGSDSIKLFEIAQTEGVEVARKLGDVLAGETDFSTFVRRGGKELEIFKKEFDNIFKQQQAIQFFKGERVAEKPQLRGGFGINIEEEAIRRAIGTFTPRVSLERAGAIREFQRLEELNVRVEAPIEMNVNIDASKLSEVQDVFVDKVAQQLPQTGSKINKALAQALGNKQNQVL